MLRSRSSGKKKKKKKEELEASSFIWISNRGESARNSWAGKLLSCQCGDGGRAALNPETPPHVKSLSPSQPSQEMTFDLLQQPHSAELTVAFGSAVLICSPCIFHLLMTCLLNMTTTAQRAAEMTLSNKSVIYFTH